MMKNVNQHSKKFSRTPISRFLLLGCVSVLAACGDGSVSQDANQNRSAHHFNSVVPYANYYVTGELEGLSTGNEVKLSKNNTDHRTLSKNGPFKFNKSLPDGYSYNVTIDKLPFLQDCDVSNGSGHVSTNITAVKVTCTPPAFQHQHNLSDINGNHPWKLIQDGEGNFYGFTLFGGDSDLGTVFKITPDGVLKPLYSFNIGDTGLRQPADLILGRDGNLYGTTLDSLDSPNYGGAIFMIEPDSGKMTVLYTFATSDFPQGLVEDKVNAGIFYGNTLGYGQFNTHGSVFKIDTKQGKKGEPIEFFPLHSFNGTDGTHPSGRLVWDDKKQLFYGTTEVGGQHAAGTIYSITSSGALETLYSFKGSVDYVPSDDGAIPVGPLAKGNDGHYYGMTERSGLGGKGTLYQFKPDNPEGKNVKDLVHFNYNGTDGATPLEGGLTLGDDGKFYGTTGFGSKAGSNLPTLFSFTPPTNSEAMGKLDTLHLFNSNDNPLGGLLKSKKDGNLYGVTHAGGTQRKGTVFKFGRK